MRPLWLLALAACGDPDPAPRARATEDSGSATADGADGTDGTWPGDSGDSGGAGTDTGGTGASPCTAGLQVAVDDSPLESGSRFTVGAGPAWTDAVAATLTLTNPCDVALRFLGHPDDWLSGTGFSLLDLPPVYLEPGQSAAIRVGFLPGDEGAYTGTFALPYNQEGSPFSVELEAAATAPLTVVFVGEGRRVTTTHDYGASVSTSTWETLEAHTDVMQRGGCWGDGVFLSVGGSAESRWWTSPDGDTWTAGADASGGAMADCAFGDPGFLTSAGAPGVSADGSTWTMASGAFDPNHLRAMSWGDGAAVAVGDNGRVAVTTHGTAWDLDHVPLSGSVREIAFYDGVFVAGGELGLVATSADAGATWVEQWLGSTVNSVVATPSGFLLHAGGTLYESADGYGWTTVNASSVVPLAAVGPMVFGATGAALHVSWDGGFTWTEFHSDDGGPGYADAMVGG